MTQETAKKADKALNTFKKVTGTFSGSCAFGFVFFLVSSLILHPSSLLYAADLYPGNGSAYGGNPAPVELCPVNTAVSTPSFPANTSYVNMQPNFNWIGPSTGTAVGLASYQPFYAGVYQHDDERGGRGLYFDLYAGELDYLLLARARAERDR
ncbi:MAG: hypothetical protein A2X39_08805 [Elusimicrobia bacterium GWC2_56_31]|nr:MAG: hypothetical protein A2X39_08805 [Elusimicrobia bacterium GWC2_56_31]